MGHASRDTDHVTHVGVEAPTVGFVEIAPFDDPEDFRLAVAMARWTFSGRVGGFDKAELARAGRRRHAIEQIEPYGGDLYGKLRPAGMKK